MSSTTLLRLAPLLLALTPLAARAQDAGPTVAPTQPGAVPAGATVRHYEVLRNGQKTGHSTVTWAPSTWQGKHTLRDETTIVRRSVRNMMGHRDLFETTLQIALERDLDGTLWWQRITLEEAGRVTVEETTWTGEGYVHESRVGQEPARRIEVTLDAPVMTDAESFLGAFARKGELTQGRTFELRELDLRARAARTSELTVLPAESVEGEAGPVRAVPVRQREPDSGSETTVWIDADGAFVQLRDDAGGVYRRVTREKAQEMPVKPAEYPVTTPATPHLERVFSAGGLKVELRLQSDPDRRLPELPASPWSKPLRVRGSDAEGWVIEVELKAYDDPSAQATLPVDAARFADDLEPTALMPSNHPRLIETAKQVIGDAPTIREAARRLARFVYGSLQKQSPAVGESTALEILEQRQGDCSEHCVLFVALCRAAGIPARRCSGYTTLGSQWGAHAWAEIWTGAWIAADPTTGEIGAGARYVFFGYQDRPGSFPGVVSSRLTGRLRIVTTSLTASAEEGGQTFDLTRPVAELRRFDADARTYQDVCSGIAATNLPAGWTVSGGPALVHVRGPGITASLHVMADQGADLAQWGGQNATFAGAPALEQTWGGRRSYFVHSRRRIVRIEVDAQAPELLAAFQAAFRPTFGAPGAPAAPEAPAPGAPAVPETPAPPR